MFPIRTILIRSSFNSRTREGCDGRVIDFCLYFRVSIHAPARGAIYKQWSSSRSSSFNSRTREGCDDRSPQGGVLKNVSIHAPARGAIYTFPYKISSEQFQFTHPRGVRFTIRVNPVARFVSIHAPARGAITNRNNDCVFERFNSRTREGCDFGFARAVAEFVFQFTHPRGVRYVPNKISVHLYVSIHAPARGAITSTCAPGDTTGFNSRTREGCDVIAAGLDPEGTFQFTHPRGVRCLCIFKSPKF